MTSTRISALGLAIAAVVLAGCASTQERARSRARRDCINTREINAISALDDQHVFVKVSATRYHLFTVDQPCNGLHLARAIGIADAATRLCGDGTAMIAFDHPTVGPTRCRIRQIEPVADKAQAMELIEERAARE